MSIFDNLFNRNKNKLTIKIAGEEHTIDPNKTIHSSRAMAKYLQGDFIGAIQDYSKAILDMPQNQNLYTLRGGAYEALNKEREAEADFIKTLELDPNHYIASYRLGMLYSRRKELEKAVKWLKISFDSAPNLSNLDHVIEDRNNILFVGKQVVAGNAGNFLMQLGRFDESMKYVDAAIEIEPNYPNPYLVKGLLLAQIGRPKEGIPYLEKAVNLGYTPAVQALTMVKMM